MKRKSVFLQSAILGSALTMSALTVLSIPAHAQSVSASMNSKTTINAPAASDAMGTDTLSASVNASDSDGVNAMTQPTLDSDEQIDVEALVEDSEAMAAMEAPDSEGSPAANMQAPGLPMDSTGTDTANADETPGESDEMDVPVSESDAERVSDVMVPAAPDVEGAADAGNITGQVQAPEADGNSSDETAALLDVDSSPLAMVPESDQTAPEQPEMSGGMTEEASSPDAPMNSGAAASALLELSDEAPDAPSVSAPDMPESPESDGTETAGGDMDIPDISGVDQQQDADADLADVAESSNSMSITASRN